MARDLYRYFRVEARELTDQLGQGALQLDKGAAAPELIALMLRLAHTLKGAARVVKQGGIANQAHAIEEALAPYREPGLTVPREAIEATLKALDAITQQMAALAAQSEPPSALGGESGDAAPAPSLSGSPVESQPDNYDDTEVLLEALGAASVELAALQRGATLLQQGRRLAQSLEEQWAGGAGANAASAKTAAMMAQLRQHIEGAYRALGDGFEQMERELLQVREAAERLRLLPASLMFVPLERAARDTGRGLGKRVAFRTSGGKIRLDTQIFNAVQSALVQAVRNAVAHGIETTAERAAAGKAAEGHVVVQVRQRGREVAFVCRDDGRGVDLHEVRLALERKGLSATAAATLGSEELLQRLLAGGISTSGAVTQHAGRGIGLDVVREAVNRLRGKVALRSDRGVGTTLEIVVPMTLAALDALIVESAGRTVAIPLDAVKRTLRVAADDLMESAQGASILFDGKVVPFAPLERALRHTASAQASARCWSAVVIEGATALAAVGVERLRGTQNLILRPLPELTPCDPLVAGASLDAEGHPQLILDPQGMVESVRRAGATPAFAPAPRAPILIIDDSLTTRMLEQSILESAGYEVDLAVSGEDALERARLRRYALFLVDVEMPGMDGFTFIERARGDPALRDIPAVLVTSRASVEDRRRGQLVGARAYIVKGEFDQTELLGQLRLLIGPQ